jgi:hypothetical protein
MGRLATQLALDRLAEPQYRMAQPPNGEWSDD